MRDGMLDRQIEREGESEGDGSKANWEREI